MYVLFRPMSILLIIALFMAIGCSENLGSTAKEPSLDMYGGLTDITGNNKSGFFRTQLINNRWLLVDPDNHIFFSIGANSVRFDGAGSSPFFGFSEYTHNLMSLFPSPFQQYTKLEWVQETINRYKELGFNTLGNWSENGLTTFCDTIPYTLPMNFLDAVTSYFGSNNCPVVNKGFWTSFPDVYDSRFTENAYAYAKQTILPGFVTDPWLIGYFTDNEISWFGGAQLIYNPNHTLADDFIGLPFTYAGKQYWVNTFLQKNLGYTLDKLNNLYGTAFTSWTQVLDITSLPNNSSYPQIQLDKQAFLYDIALTYFSVANAAIKSVDPNHLNLCARFASYAPDQVIEAASQYCDVISVNDYYALDNPLSDTVLGDPVQRWKHMFELSMIHNPYGKPFIQSEFGTRAEDSGLPNLKGAGWTVKAQSDRIQYYRDDINRLLNITIHGIAFMTGFHWFEWSDEPATGRFDGENSNYGIVNIKDEAYKTFFSGITNTNRMLLYNLDFKAPPQISPPANISLSVLQNGDIQLSWNSTSYANSYEIIISPYRSMPDGSTLVFKNINETNFILPYNLSQGWWWFTIRSIRNNIESDFAPVTGFYITATINNTVSCTNIDNLSCFTNNITDTFPNPDNSTGSAVILPSINIRDQGTQSGKISFTLNSLALLGALNNATELTLSMNQPIDATGFTVLTFDVYPEVVYTPSGIYKSATDFVHVRLTTNEFILYDAPLPQSLPVFQWSTVSVPITGSDVLISFYINKNTPDIPYDQRITFYLDNINLTNRTP